MSHIKWLWISVLLSASGHAKAADSPVDIELGRVFMTADERSQLDRLRQIPEPQLTNTTQAIDEQDEVASRSSATPSGFIKPSNGAPYKWIDGDFRKVSSEQIETKSSSPRIRIITHRQSSTESDRGSVTGNKVSNSDAMETAGESGTPWQ